MTSGVTMERVVDKIRELEARIRALERLAEDDRTLDDIRTSITMLADSMANGRPGPGPAEAHVRSEKKPDASGKSAAASGKSAADSTALADPRFRVV